MRRRRSADRGISPVVGVTLLVAIAVVLAAGAAVFVLDLTQKEEPKPNVMLDVDAEDAGVTHSFVHEGGEVLDGDKLTLRGAADPEVLHGQEFGADDTASFVAVEQEITVVYTGEYGSSYTLGTFEADQTIPAPDEGCEWVETESNGGVADVKVPGIVVNCDVETEKNIEVLDGGIVIGDVVSEIKALDADDAAVYGDVETEAVANVQNTTVSGSIRSVTADAKIDAGSAVDGSVRAQKLVDVDAGSTIGGDLVSENKVVDVQDSTVEGSITADEQVKLDDSTVEGDVYIESSNFDCTSSSINGQSCSEYTPKDPDSY